MMLVVCSGNIVVISKGKYVGIRVKRRLLRLTTCTRRILLFLSCSAAQCSPDGWREGGDGSIRK